MNDKSDSPELAPVKASVLEKAQVLTTNDLIAGRREIEAPFLIQANLAGRNLELSCDRLFRLLPGRRLVVRTRLDTDWAIAKIFIGEKGLRDYEREKQGVIALLGAGVPTPEILADGDVFEGGKILLFQYLAGSRSLLDVLTGPLAENKGLETIQQVLGVIGRMHESGVVQEDIHLDNFLYDSSVLHTIDGGGVKSRYSGKSVSEAQGIKNLAQFFAQLTPGYDGLVESALPAYEHIRGYQKSNARVKRLKDQVKVQRHKRKAKYLKKIFRECSQIVHQSGFRHLLLCERRDWNLELERMLKDPDEAMSRGRSLKIGNSATVVEVQLNDRMLVVKRYNIKNFLHGIRRLFKSSRARKSWYNSHLMEFLGIPGPRPVALLERRWGPFCFTAYFLSESVQGQDARAHFEQQEPSDADLRSLVSIVMQLASSSIAHGDLKDTNFLMSEDGPVLVDLDAMREFRSARRFRKAAVKDRRRFMQNWAGQPELADRLRKKFEEMSVSGELT